MKNMKQLFWMMALWLSPVWGQELPKATIGVLVDGDSGTFLVESMEILEREAKALLSRDYDVAFPADKTIIGRWQMANIEAGLQSLLADDDVDMVVCLGILSGLAAARQGGPFNKPVFVPFGISADLPIYPIEGESSGVRNFHYLVTPSRLQQDIALIARMNPSGQVHVLADEAIAGSVPGVTDWVKEIFAKQGLEATTVTGAERADELLSKLGSEVEMVYVTPLLRFDEAQRRTLFEGLKRKGIPSVSLSGWDEVALGALAGNAPQSDDLRLFRRVALNMQRALGGEDPGTFPVVLTVTSKLAFNMETARAIDWFPDWDLQISAELLNVEETETARRLTLEGAVLQAIEANLDLAATRLDPDLAARETARAKSQRLPQVEASVTGVQIDEDLAEVSFGAQPEKQVRGSLDLQQVIFSDGLNAGVTINQLLEEVAALDLEIVKLDIARETAIRFLGYLQANTFNRIQRDNLDLTRENLDTARIRESIGIVGRSDVFRWESQLAIDQREAIDANAQMEAALAALNQILHYTQEARIEAITPDLLDPNLMTGRGRLEPFVRNAKDFALFRGFMVAEGLRKVPELKRIDTIIAIKQREIATNTRVFYLPTVAFTAGLDHDFSRSGAGAEGGLNIPGVMLPNREDTSWQMAINLSIPVFKGGERRHTLGQSRIELEQLRIQRRSAAEKVELSIRVALQRVGSSAAAIDLSRAAADAAQKNYALVRDAYAKGVAQAIDLLDAQNAALVADLAAANAVHAFLIELMDFQRAAANMDFFLTAEERNEFFERLEAFFQQFDQ